MKFKALLIAGAIVAIAVPTAGAAKGGNGTTGGGTTLDSVTGGGQTFFDGRDPSGAGDTIAFQARRTKDAQGTEESRGQIQVNRRGTNAVKFHGNITCLNVSGEPKSGSGYAYMSGTSRSGEPFELFVQDGGKGPQERNDLIMLFVGSETANNDSDNEDANEVCGFEDFDPGTDAISMARGNVQVRNRSTAEDDDPDAGTETAAPATLPALL